MAIVLDIREDAIRRGIRTVGVGKKGSKSLSGPLAQEIAEDLKAGKVTPASAGAFFAGLFYKGTTPDEEVLDSAFETPGALKDPRLLVKALASDAPDFAQDICLRLLSGQTLDKSTAYRLGQFLLSDAPGDGARGLIASLLRVRYETDDEYEGLLTAINDTIVPAFHTPVPSGEPIIQMAEPFDGNDHSYMVTPLLGRYAQGLGYRVVHLTGRNSGPKSVYNLLDVADALAAPYMRGNGDLGDPKPEYGWFIRQKDLSPAVDRWVDIRRQTIKRPFLATLEKFLNPVAARIVVTSAFHPPYGEKMRTVSERAGFTGIVVVRNGMEGGLGFPLLRPAKILLSARQKDGFYLRHEITFDAAQFLGVKVEVEEKMENLSAAENARFIEHYARTGSSDNLFDLRVKATCEGLRRAVEWLENNMIGREPV